MTLTQTITQDEQLIFLCSNLLLRCSNYQHCTAQAHVYGYAYVLVKTDRFYYCWYYFIKRLIQIDNQILLFK